jgi:hypothetical protein
VAGHDYGGRWALLCGRGKPSSTDHDLCSAEEAACTSPPLHHLVDRAVAGARKIEELVRRRRNAGSPPMSTSTDEDVLVVNSDEEVLVAA